MYYKTHTCYCFSTNCPTHGRAMDVIDFILHKEGCTKHEAILKAKAMVEGKMVAIPQNGAGEPGRKQESERATLLEQVFTYFRNGVHNSGPAKAYLAGRCLDYTRTEVGYNSGQFHHGKRKDEGLIRACVEHGILLDLGTKSRTGNAAYKPFGKWCVVFPLRDEGYRITGLYFRSTLEKKNQRHFYLKGREGLYPHYPKQETRKLILTESIIDAASLLEQDGIKSKYGVLALYGTNGLTEEHQRAIKELPRLEEIIFFLNGDEAGRSAVAKYAPMLKTEYPELKITTVQVPENEDVNSLLQGHGPEILQHLIKTRKEYDYVPAGSQVLFSVEKSVEPARPAGGKEKDERADPAGAKAWEAFGGVNREADGLEATEPAPAAPVKTQNTASPQGLDTNNPYNPEAPYRRSGLPGLDCSNPYSLKYTGSEARYQIKGFRLNQLDSLKITLQIIAS